MSNEAIREIEGLLEGQLESVNETNKRSMIMGGIVLVLFGGYLLWANAQVNKLLDPEGLALAATGLALESIPGASQALRSVVVDGAPDIARASSQAIVDMLPAYREIMEEEMAPVIDEVTGILAQTTVQHMVAAAKESGGAEVGAAEQQAALQAAADGVVTRFDAIIEDAMDEAMENDGPTPRESIEASLGQLVTVDRGLKRVVKGQGDPQERELLLAWIDLIGQYQVDANTAAAAEHSNSQNVKKAAAAKKDGEAAQKDGEAAKEEAAPAQE